MPRLLRLLLIAIAAGSSASSASAQGSPTRAAPPAAQPARGEITNDPSFFQVSDRAREIRGIGISVTWTFGKPDKEKGDLIGDPPAN